MAFRHEIRVTWADCDPARIAYTGRIPNWALEAIDAWWEAHLGAGWYQMELEHGFGTPFVHMSLDFKAPIKPPHRLECEVRPVRLGTKSVEFQVDGYQNGTLCFSGRFVNVFTQALSLNTRPAPDEARALIERHLPECVD